jgi:hypothetical protein
MFGYAQFVPYQFSLEHFLGLETESTIYADGRRPTTVNQAPGGGEFYPFLRPLYPSYDETKVSYHELFADLWFEHTGDFAPGFKIGWLLGFGTNIPDTHGGPPPPEPPTQVHPYDLVIYDSLGAVAFNSAEATGYREAVWGQGGRLLLLEWWTDDAVVRASIYRGWGPNDVAVNFDKNWRVDAWLAARTYAKAPKRLRGLVVNSQVLTGAVDVEGVYNVALQPAVAARIDGQAKTSSLGVRMNPGDGRGRFPGCEDIETVLRYINDVSTSDGRFRLEFGDCLRGDQKLALGPAGAHPVVPGKSDADAAATLYLRNDCGVCCDCQYYLNTYKAIRRQYNRLQLVVADLNDAHDVMEVNRQRYIDQKTCREAQPLQLELLPEPAGRFSVAAGYCNLTGACIGQLQLLFKFEAFENDVPYDIAADGVQCGYAYVSTRASGRPLRQSMAGTFPTWSVYFDSLNPYDSARASFRFCLPSPAVNKSLKLTVSMHSAQPLPAADGTIYTLPTLGSPPATSFGPTRAVAIAAVGMNPATTFSVGCQC